MPTPLSRFFGGSPLKLRNPFSGDGLNSPGIRVSTNGMWPALPRRAAETTTAIRPRGMASNSSIVVAVGSAYSATEVSTNTAYSSPTGAVWTARTLPTSQVWYDVIWTGTKFYATSSGVNTAVSTDGITWTAGAVAPASACYIHSFNGLLFLFPVGGGTTYYTSADDAATWTTRTLPFSVDSSSIFVGKANTSSVMVINGLISSGTFPKLYYTTNGTSWTQATSPTLFDGNTASALGGQQLVSNGTNFFLICRGTSPNSNNLYCSISSNGATWSDFNQIKLNTITQLSTNEYTNNLFGATGGARACAWVNPDIGRVWAFNGLRVSIPVRYGEYPSEGTLAHGVGFIHTVDGLDWTFEPRMVIDTDLGNANPSYMVCAKSPNSDGLVFGFGAQNAAKSWYLRTNPQFKELSYVY